MEHKDKSYTKELIKTKLLKHLFTYFGFAAGRRANPVWAKPRFSRIIQDTPIDLFTSPNPAFTLVEVLITLVIIGIVAALTLSPLISSYKEKHYVTALKEIYSILCAAYISIIYEEGNYSSWDMLPTVYETDENGKYILGDDNSWHNLNGDANVDSIYFRFKPYLHISKDCNHGESGCWPELITQFNSSGTNKLVTAQFGIRKFVLLKNGMCLGFGNGSLYVDLNGFKAPNKVGVDIFQFFLGENLIEPYDIGEGVRDVSCYTNAYTCSGWVIVNENLDYLHCDDLKWNSKTKCE